MRDGDLAILDQITLQELEIALDLHTRDRVPVDQWTQFSWSTSRHAMFEQCRRQYYLNYYGARRVRDAGSAIVSAVWWLKQVTTLPMWIGSTIHEIAALAIRAYRDGQPLTEQAVVDKALAYFRAGVSASTRGAKADGKWIMLLEHMRDDTPADTFTEAENTVASLAKTLIHSDAYQWITSLPPEAIVEVDEPFQSFDLEDVPPLGFVRVFAIPDVLVQNKGMITIIDWKTGDAARESIRDQAGVYRYYAHKTYGVPEHQINVQIIELAGSGGTVSPSGGVPSLEESRGFITSSIARMVEQMDYMEYNTVALRDFPMTDNLAICRHCGFQRACWRDERNA